tara:strand:- start:772 stop:1011 length:240 start_codon:yes stop_codon:yes gene_type:complete
MSIRQYRIFGIAIFDLVLGIIGMVTVFLIAKHYHFPNMKVAPFIIAAVILTIPVGMTFHIIFGVNSTLNYRLGLSNKPS